MTAAGIGFAESLWPLLLVPPGLLLLWMQLPKGFWRAGKTGYLHGGIFLLQGTALFLLAFSLCGPEWRSLATRFHPPAVIIAVDESDSFAGGTFLAAGEAVASTLKRLREEYAGRGFRVYETAFHEHAEAEAEGGAGSDTTGKLTDFSALEKFLDTLSLPNVQGVLLFSDGRHTRDGRNRHGSRYPVYPVVHSLAGVGECQLESLEWLEGASGSVDSFQVTWSSVGAAYDEADAQGPLLHLRDGKHTLYEGVLPLSRERSAHVPQTVRLALAKPLQASGATYPIVTAVLTPAVQEQNLTSLNDTMKVASAGRGGLRINMLLPFRSLEERALVDALRRWPEASVNLIKSEEISDIIPGPGEQVWISVANLMNSSVLRAYAARNASGILLYAPGGFDVRLQSLLVAPVEIRSFSESALMRKGEGLSRFSVPDGLLLGKMAIGPLSLPLEGGHAQSSVQVTEAGQRGVLLGTLETREGFFRHWVLPRAWPRFFTNRPAFGSEALWQDLVQSAVRIAGSRPGMAEMYYPREVIAGVPFDISGRLPSGAKGVASEAPRLRVMSAEGVGEHAGKAVEGNVVFQNLRLPEGRVGLELVYGGEVAAHDSLEVVSKQRVELSRIGYDEAALAHMAASGGGQVLRESDGALAVIPELPNAELSEVRETVYPLYNTVVQVLLVSLLLAGSWLLRKRVNLD